MAKTVADSDRRESFNFYQLLRAVEDRLSLYEGADCLSKMDPEEQSLRQLVKQFCNQQPVISKDAILQPPVIFQPNETAGVCQASQGTDLELKELRQREGRLLDPARPDVHGGALTQQQSPTIDQEVDEMVGQLRSQKLTKTELAAAAPSMPFLDRIRIDQRKFTTLPDQAAVQGPAQGYSPAPGYEDWQNSTRYPQDSRPPQDS